MHKSQTAQISILTILSLFLTTCQKSSSNPEFDYELVAVNRHTAAVLYPIDLDSDGIDELFFDYGEQINITDVDGKNVYASFIKVDSWNWGTLPLISNTLDSIDILARHQVGDTVLFDRWHYKIRNREISRTKGFLKITGEDRDGDGSLLLSISPIGAIKGYNGRDMAIIAFGSAKDGVQRGVSALDLASGTFVWQFKTGPQVLNVVLEDIDNDGIDEIAVGTYAPDNGIQVNNMPDDSSYVVLLNADGNVRWKRTVGDYFTGGKIDVGDITGDGRKEIIVYRYSLKSPEDGQDEVMLLNPVNGAILKKIKCGEKFHQPANLRTRYLHDLTRNGRKEIILGNSDGVLRVLDANLNILRSTKPSSGAIKFLGVADLDGDYIDEIICYSLDGYLHILSQDLKLLVSQRVTEGEINIARGRLNNRIIISESPAGNSDWRIHSTYSLRKITAITRTWQANKPFLITGFSALVLAGFLYLLWYLYYSAAGYRMITGILEQAGLLEKMLIVRSNGIIDRAGSDWNQLLGLENRLYMGKSISENFSANGDAEVLSAIKELMQQEDDGQKKEVTLEQNEQKSRFSLASRYVPFLRRYFIQLTDLSQAEYIHRVQSWAPVAQRMAHGIKNPLTAVKLNTEELRDLIKTEYRVATSGIDQYFAAILMQVSKLTRISDRFMRFVQLERPKLHAQDINQLIVEFLAQWQPQHMDDIEIKFEPSAKLPKALLDMEQFNFVFKTVFFNAIESIDRKGRILITNSVVELFSSSPDIKNTRFIELRMQDTGCGIPAEILHKIGEPYVTNKASGTGLGLSIVRKVMQEHGGSFEIDSEKNVGTVVSLRFLIA